ncbi:hypothetical protein QVD17_31395 [Tagetes erecta]|uniref:DUF4378 domain-containing protein n=1 Tax=Tagetes erecta TaxID=13708 RepID=A0AAD8K3N8_TARER|nr:hypothetical protein QVD17_31395 [Tagetes erecta]
MKQHMMTIEQNKASVIAKLMGFDDSPPRQQQQQSCRVYRQQRVGSIGSHECRSRTNRRKMKIKKDLANGGCFNGMQGFESPIVDNRIGDVEERKDVGAKNLVLRPNLGKVKRESRPLFLRDSHIGWEFKKQILERSKRTKVCKQIWSSKQVYNLGETPPCMLDLESRLELAARVIINNFDGWKDNSATKSPIIKRSSSGNNTKNMPKCDLNLSSVGRDKNVSTNSQDAEFSCSIDVSSEKELVCEERFTSLNCIEMNDELTRSTGEAYQPSPNSVLEPDNSSSSEYGESVCVDLHGLWMKLQVLKSESDENLSEFNVSVKPESVALSNEAAIERCVSVDQSTKAIRCFGPKESQQFSYLVNVLNEMGFHGGDVELDFENCMANPEIFKTLEKKYENQESWNKADRRLLFDCINLGLTKMAWSKPLRRKMSNGLRRDMVEEELWNMLVSQEKEVNADLSKKAVGNEPWLELRDEVDLIVVEIEAFLYNELVTELVAS